MPMASATIVPLDGGAFWQVTFGTEPGNILDQRTLADLTRVFHDAASAPDLKGVCLTGAGAHFSFGASIDEHLPPHVEGLLRAVREMLVALLDSRVVVAAAVRGRCLGGGLELASVCHRVFASREATFAQPEIALGVFAPVASLVLAGRTGRAVAEDVCLTGRTLLVAEAHAVGLVDEIVDGDVTLQAEDWLRQHFAGRSAKSLRLAVAAIRGDLEARIRLELPVLERRYLSDLMTAADPHEGLRAFLEKRPPVWKNR
jgi:cyclohexa-1,5-dienecarbonyl-CoA hydratase